MPTSMYTGTIIEESLKQKLDPAALGITITKTDISPVSESHHTPWLAQWTLHRVEIPDETADIFAQWLSEAILLEPGTWYADYKDEKAHYIIFPSKIFHVERTEAGYKEVIEYGLAHGIPAHQLDFSEHIV